MLREPLAAESVTAGPSGSERDVRDEIRKSGPPMPDDVAAFRIEMAVHCLEGSPSMRRSTSHRVASQIFTSTATNANKLIA